MRFGRQYFLQALKTNDNLTLCSQHLTFQKEPLVIKNDRGQTADRGWTVGLRSTCERILRTYVLHLSWEWGLLSINIYVFKWAADGFETLTPITTEFLKYIPCLGQHPQFYYPFRKKDKMADILFWI